MLDAIAAPMLAMFFLCVIAESIRFVAIRIRDRRERALKKVFDANRRRVFK